MNFIFISPNFPKSYYLFCEALKNNGVRTLGIGEDSLVQLSPACRDSLDDYYQVQSLEDYNQVFKAVAFFSYKYGKIDWVESNNEYWLTQDAKLRTDFNIQTGVQYNDIRPYKFKSEMKKYYKKANVVTARHHLVSTLDKAKEFILQVGYPVIVKPDSGVGASTTYKLSNEKEVMKFFKNIPSYQVIMEEYIEGEIISYDGICDANSNIIYETAHQFPNSIMDIVNEKKEIFYYSYKHVPSDLKEIGQRVIRAFDVKSRFFHCEYFRLLHDKEGIGKKGDLVALEVNMRPPGGYTPDMMNFASDISVYQIWANMICFNEGQFDPEHRPYVCVYYGRRDEINHKLSHSDVLKKYKDHLCMCERMPEIFQEAMGNQMYTARFETTKQALNFIHQLQQ
ncbi:ATP-grasp domain-containing protein [Anaerorhabdus furcosa]|uniref:ATP-grasp domain-containing protein n=1 Tax=Anaerorhabdus furcosa TaxID=118967 RepID=A0A1T4LFV0_9FIRM|nr:ATP-grasp domain-containing protein [Anaerorhabdus furcosa]SJZ53520.1 ATP-grasp domain-containing protein [Anaerorhabdus furcosa]